MKAWLRLVRFEHWTKNVLLFAPLFFALEFSKQNLGIISIGFLAFSFMASAVYIMNDLIDIKEDQAHPIKKLRPVAAGQISTSVAISMALACVGLAVCIAIFLPWQFGMYLLTYGLLNIAYSLYFKKIVLLDVLCIALGFIVRILAGSALISVVTSHWIILCVFFGALFLGFAKRKYEIDHLTDRAIEHRSVLSHYTSPLLGQLMGITATITIITYTLYTIDFSTIQRFQTDALYITVIFVVFGILRYFFISQSTALRDDPTRIFLTDKPLQITVLLWLLSFFLIITL